MRKQVGSVDELGKQQEATKEDLFTVQPENRQEGDYCTRRPFLLKEIPTLHYPPNSYYKT